MSAAQHQTPTNGALPLARPRDVLAAASVISHAFGWKPMTGSRWRPRPSWRERTRTGLIMPITLLLALSTMHGRQLYYRPGVTLTIDFLNARRRPVHARDATIGIALPVAVLLLTSLRSPRLAVTLGWAMIAAMAVFALVLVIGLIAMYWCHADNRRECKNKGYTECRKPRSGATFPPPKPPTWRTATLAADPRRRHLGGLEHALNTLDAVVPSGEVVEGTAASPRHVLAYTRAGFVQWHEKSLAMWKLMP